jgi:hypothetical protein
MFCDRGRMGAFAVPRAALAAGRPGALFRAFVASTVFQRLQDVLVFRILAGIPRATVQELTSPMRLLRLADASPCRYAHTRAGLERSCDLAKDPETALGTCAARPRLSCHLKRHTVVLKRYGDFGKVPSSAALMLREHGVPDLAALRRRVFERTSSPGERAALLADRLRAVWRVDRKIAALFLSAVSNPDLSPGLASWSAGVDWTRFIVLDSNVDRFLASLGYDGPGTYEAREAFVAEIAERIDLSRERKGLHTYNPRLVQQAMYLFMSTTNRRASRIDCCWDDSCASCPAVLRTRCALRHRAGARVVPPLSSPAAPQAPHRRAGSTGR